MLEIDRTKKYRWFRTNTHDPECIERLKITCRINDRWFYAMHEPDDEDGTPHLHLVIMRSPAKIITVSRQLGIPENFIQPAINYKRDIRYLIHKDNPEKKQYDPSIVTCSHPGIFKSMLIDVANDDISDLFSDLRKLGTGKISQDEFITLHFKELQDMTTYQKIKIFEYLEKLSIIIHKDGTQAPT